MTGPPPPAAGPDPTDATGPTHATDPTGARGPTAPAEPDPAEHDPAEHDPARRAALDAVRAGLAGLADPPVPPEYAARWSAALAAEGDRPASGSAEPLAPTRTARRRWPRPAAVAALLLGALLVAGVPGTGSPSPEVDRVGLAAAALAALGSTDVGELADAERRAGCLRALPDAGVAPEATLLGGRRVTYAGRAAVLLVLATGERGRFRVVVVDPACGPTGGTLLGSEPVGGR